MRGCPGNGVATADGKAIPPTSLSSASDCSTIWAAGLGALTGVFLTFGRAILIGAGAEEVSNLFPDSVSAFGGKA